MDRRKFIGRMATLTVAGTSMNMDMMSGLKNSPALQKKGQIPRRVLGKTGVEVICMNVAAARMKPLTREEQISVEQLMINAS